MEKYKTILDNLIDVNTNDSCFFTNFQVDKNLDKPKFFDLYQLFGERTFYNVLSQENFQISLNEQTLFQTYQRIELTNSEKELVRIVDELKDSEILFDKAFYSILENNHIEFIDKKNQILEKLQAKVQLSIQRWIKLKDYSNSFLEETNTWPLHIGTLFVSLKYQDKEIYAPLLFKEVKIDINGGKPILRSEGEIKVNDKLIFFLNNNGFAFNLNDDLDSYSFNKVIDHLRFKWKDIYQIPTSLLGPFKHFAKSDIQNNNVKFHIGAVLGIFQPSGGYARSRMKQIIQNGELDSILDISIDKNVYVDTINEKIFNKNIALFRLTPSNLSQDKATISALNQHTIIWGPPGTGKSQTIVNILANILIFNKTAIVGSQKKIALEVLKKRLGELSIFGLFMLNFKKETKKNFYQPIKEYIDLLEHHRINDKVKVTKMIEQVEEDFVKQCSFLFENKEIRDALEAIYYLAAFKDDYQGLKDILYVTSLPKDLIYPERINQGFFAKELLQSNNSKIIFTKKYRELKELGRKIDKEMHYFKGNLRTLVKKFSKFVNFDLAKPNPDNVLYKLNQLKELADQINWDLKMVEQKVLREMIMNRIALKLHKFEASQKREYQEFSASVRARNLKPTKFLKKYSNIIKEIYPMVISTPDADLSMWEKEEFDYAILDESSQIFIENGLTFLYLAKTKILSGDPKQMRPSNWFGARLTDETLYGTIESMLDYGLSLGMHSVLLDKNYRSSYASLMTFSSKNFYQSKLDVVNSATNTDDNPIEVFEVNGVWQDHKNLVESQLALRLTDENLDKYDKIILLSFNVKQADFLLDSIYNGYDRLLLAYQNGKLMIKNLENIQGDEADLVIMTVAYDKHTKLNSTYVAKQGGMNALNVAITRAKEKMIVIKTIKADEVMISENSSEDLRIFKSWLSFLESSSEKKLNLLNESFIRSGQKAKNNEARKWFEKIMIDAFRHKFDRPGFDVFRQYSVGSINIDFVITFNNVPYKSIILDLFEYENGLSGYAELKDKIRFLKSKQYDVVVVNPLNFPEIFKEMDQWLKIDVLSQFKEETKLIETSYFDLNDINQTSIIHEIK